MLSVRILTARFLRLTSSIYNLESLRSLSQKHCCFPNSLKICKKKGKDFTWLWRQNSKKGKVQCRCSGTRFHRLLRSLPILTSVRILTDANLYRSRAVENPYIAHSLPTGSHRKSQEPLERFLHPAISCTINSRENKRAWARSFRDTRSACCLGLK